MTGGNKKGENWTRVCKVEWSLAGAIYWDGDGLPAFPAPIDGRTSTSSECLESVQALARACTTKYEYSVTFRLSTVHLVAAASTRGAGVHDSACRLSDCF